MPAQAHSRHAYCILSTSTHLLVPVSYHASTWRCNASTSRNGEQRAQVRHRDKRWKDTCTCILLPSPLSGYVGALVPACLICCCCMHTHIGAAEQRCSDHFFLVSHAHENVPPHLLWPILVSLPINMQFTPSPRQLLSSHPPRSVESAGGSANSTVICTYGMRHKRSIKVYDHSEAQAQLQAYETVQST